MNRDAEIFNLYKYFIWSDRMRTSYDAIIDQRVEEMVFDVKFEIETNLYMSYWFSSLYVVIEGWKELGMKDERVDALLHSRHVKLLRRYRNGVFHFQRDYFDERFMGFFRDGIDRLDWIRRLHMEFESYFYRWANEHRGFLGW